MAGLRRSAQLRTYIERVSAGTGVFLGCVYKLESAPDRLIGVEQSCRLSFYSCDSQPGNDRC